MFEKYMAAIKLAKTSYELAEVYNSKTDGIDQSFQDGKITFDEYMDLSEAFEIKMEKLERAEGLYDEEER